jgi:hypothetical protein
MKSGFSIFHVVAAKACANASRLSKSIEKKFESKRKLVKKHAAPGDRYGNNIIINNI